MNHPTADPLTLCNGCEANTANPNDPGGYCDECRFEPTDERLRNLASLRFGQTVTTSRNGGLAAGFAKMARRAGLPTIAVCALIGYGGQALPAIGTPAYSLGCEITHAWEDGSAIAYCPEDGASYVHDPDGQWVEGVPENPVREPGWYVCAEDCLSGDVDYTTAVTG